MTGLVQVDALGRMILDPTSMAALLANSDDPSYPTRACCPCPEDPPSGNVDACECFEFDDRDLIKGNRFLVEFGGEPYTITGYHPGEPLHAGIKCSFPLGELVEDGTCTTPRDAEDTPSVWPGIVMSARLAPRSSVRVRSCRNYANTFSFGSDPLLWEWAGAAQVTNSLLTLGADASWTPPPAPLTQYLVAHLRRIGTIGGLSDEFQDDVTTDQCYCGHPDYPLEESDDSGATHRPFFLLRVLQANTPSDPLSGWTVTSSGGRGLTVYGPAWTASDVEGWRELFSWQFALCSPGELHPPRLNPFTYRAGVIQEFENSCGAFSSWQQTRFVDLLGL